jgi:hypothetical protein
MFSNTNVMLSNSAFPDVCGAPPPVNPIPIPYPNLTPGSLAHANHIDGQAHAGNKKALTAQKNIIEKAQGKSSVTIKSVTQAKLLNTAS